MRQHLLLFFSASCLLSLAACGGGEGLQVKNSAGKAVGKIEVQGNRTGTFLDIRDEERGKVRGNIVRDNTGKNLGTIAEQDGHIVLLDGKENPLGSVEKGTDCYGKGQDKLGTISAGVDSYVAAGACLVFFLQ